MVWRVQEALLPPPAQIVVSAEDWAKLNMFVLMSAESFVHNNWQDHQKQRKAVASLLTSTGLSQIMELKVDRPGQSIDLSHKPRFEDRVDRLDADDEAVVFYIRPLPASKQQ